MLLLGHIKELSFFSFPSPAQFAVSYIFAKRLPTEAKYSLLFHRIQRSTLDNFLALLQNIAAYTFANSNTMKQKSKPDCFYHI